MIVTVSAAVLLCLALFFYVHYRTVRLPRNNSQALVKMIENYPNPIVFLGDSLTHGKVSYDYIRHLTSVAPFKAFDLVNDGINYSLTYQVLERLETAVQLDPKFVFVMVGTNDLISTLSDQAFEDYEKQWGLEERTSVTTFKRNMDAIVLRLKAKTDAKIFLVSIPPLGEDPESTAFRGSVEYSKYVAEAAIRHGVGYVPLNESLVDKIKRDSRYGRIGFAADGRNDQQHMFWVICQHIVFLSDWNTISDRYDRMFLTDSIHMNERAGNILVELLVETLARELELPD